MPVSKNDKTEELTPAIDEAINAQEPIEGVVDPAAYGQPEENGEFLPKTGETEPSPAVEEAINAQEPMKDVPDPVAYQDPGEIEFPPEPPAENESDFAELPQSSEGNDSESEEIPEVFEESETAISETEAEEEVPFEAESVEQAQEIPQDVPQEEPVEYRPPIYTPPVYPMRDYSKPEETPEEEKIAPPPLKPGKVKPVPPKTTLNLCMKEKNVVSVALFVPLLAIILVLAVVIGYFGVYRRYEALNEAQAALDQDKARLEQILSQIEDYDEVRDQFNRYNYEDYDRTLADRLEIFEMLDRIVFPICKVQTLSINRLTLSLTLTGLTLEEAGNLKTTLEAEDLVDLAAITGYNSSETNVSVISVNITLADASKGGKA